MPTLTKLNTTWIIALLCLITSMGRFVMDNYLPSLPAIAAALQISENSVQLTLTLYMLGFGISQLIYGPLSDRYGRKKILLAGLTLFLLTNTLCAFSNSFALLLAARFLAGLGMGVCGVLNRAIASDCFSGAEFSKVWSYTTTTLVLVLMIAPLIGSGIQELFYWHANFIVGSIFAGITLYMIVWKLPETNQTHRLESISIKKIFTHYKEIIATPAFITSTLCYTFAFAGLIAYFQISPLLFMNALGLSPLQYGYTSLLIALSYLAGGVLVSQLARKLGTQPLLVIGICIIIMAGLWMLSWNSGEKMTLPSVLIPCALYVMGARIIIPNAMANAFIRLRHLGGSASGLIGGIQISGAALISFTMTYFDYRSPLPLGFLFSLLGISALITFFLISFFDTPPTPAEKDSYSLLT